MTLVASYWQNRRASCVVYILYSSQHSRAHRHVSRVFPLLGSPEGASIDLKVFFFFFFVSVRQWVVKREISSSRREIFAASYDHFTSFFSATNCLSRASRIANARGGFRGGGGPGIRTPPFL